MSVNDCKIIVNIVTANVNQPNKPILQLVHSRMLKCMRAMHVNESATTEIVAAIGNETKTEAETETLYQTL